MKYHKPVMLQAVLENLKIKKKGRYIDCTLGDGGHTIEILKLGGTVLGIDINENSLRRAYERIKSLGFKDQFIGVKGNFKDIENLSEDNGFSRVDGILYDLGYSSNQLDEDKTGLSFLKNQPLDMRLDKSLGVTAADLLNALPEKELAKILFEYSDERYSRRFAKAIVEHRNLKKFQTTKDLTDLIVSVASPGYEYKRIHPATRVFQTLRIAVNGDIYNLEQSLPRAAHILLPGGRMIIISFHSLEDKVAKTFGQSARLRLKEVYKKPLTPGEDEIRENIRSRSAKLRVFEKIENDQNSQDD